MVGDGDGDGGLVMVIVGWWLVLVGWWMGVSVDAPCVMLERVSRRIMRHRRPWCAS